MKNLIRLTDCAPKDVFDIFNIADEINKGKYANILRGKSVIFFSPTLASEQEFHLKKEYIC